MRWIAAIVVLVCGAVYAGEVVITLPAEVVSVSADGATTQVAGREVKLQAEAGARLNVTAQLKGGLRLVGVDMRWHRAVQPSGEQLSDEDRAEIAEILTVPSFYDRAEALHLAGDSDHVTALVQLVRDRDFHAGKGEVIWRVELWYFEFASGGWVKVSQQNKVLDRQRLKSADEYRDYTRGLRYVPSLGGVEVTDAKRDFTITEDQMLRTEAKK